MGINCVSNSELSSSLSFGICQRESENNNTLQLQERVPMATQEKQVMIVAIDESEHSMYALEWTLDHFFSPLAPNPLFKLVIVHAKPLATSVVGLAGPGTTRYLLFLSPDFDFLFSFGGKN